MRTKSAFYFCHCFPNQVCGKMFFVKRFLKTKLGSQLKCHFSERLSLTKGHPFSPITLCIFFIALKTYIVYTFVFLSGRVPELD